MKRLCCSALLALMLAGCQSADIDSAAGPGGDPPGTAPAETDGAVSTGEVPSGPADSDGDGLSDREEEDLGSDPDIEDTDGDGFLDGEEVQAGTNPLYDLSHPYKGGYNVGYCGDGEPVASGPTGVVAYGDQSWDVYQQGDVAEDFAFVDQYDEEVHLYSFCGQQVMLAFVGSGSGASTDLGQQLQALQDLWGDKGFQVIALLVEQGNSPDEDSHKAPDDAVVAADYAELYGLETVPILRLTEAAQAEGELWSAWEHDYALPTTAFLDPKMTVLSVDEYLYDPGEIGG